MSYDGNSFIITLVIQFEFKFLFSYFCLLQKFASTVNINSKNLLYTCILGKQRIIFIFYGGLLKNNAWDIFDLITVVHLSSLN